MSSSSETRKVPSPDAGARWQKVRRAGEVVGRITGALGFAYGAILVRVGMVEARNPQWLIGQVGSHAACIPGADGQSIWVEASFQNNELLPDVEKPSDWNNMQVDWNAASAGVGGSFEVAAQSSGTGAADTGRDSLDGGEVNMVITWANDDRFAQDQSDEKRSAQYGGENCPAPTPTDTATATDTALPTATETQTVSPSATASSTASEAPSVTASATATPSETATATATATATETATPTDTATATSTVTTTPTASATGTGMPVASPTSPEATRTGGPTDAPDASPTPSRTPTGTSTGTATVEVVDTAVAEIAAAEATPKGGADAVLVITRERDPYSTVATGMVYMVAGAVLLGASELSAKGRRKQAVQS